MRWWVKIRFKSILQKYIFYCVDKIVCKWNYHLKYIANAKRSLDLNAEQLAQKFIGKEILRADGNAKTDMKKLLFAIATFFPKKLSPASVIDCEIGGLPIKTPLTYGNFL